MSSSRRGEHGPGTALGTALGTQGTAGGTWSGAGVNIQTGAHGAQDAAPAAAGQWCWGAATWISCTQL